MPDAAGAGRRPRERGHGPPAAGARGRRAPAQPRRRGTDPPRRQDGQHRDRRAAARGRRRRQRPLQERQHHVVRRRGAGAAGAPARDAGLPARQGRHVPDKLLESATYAERAHTMAILLARPQCLEGEPPTPERLGQLLIKAAPAAVGPLLAAGAPPGDRFLSLFYFQLRRILNKPPQKLGAHSH